MRIKLKRVVRAEEEVDVVTALRFRAGEHVKRHLEAPMQSGKARAEAASMGDDVRPFDLWTAKLLLEIADLFQKTEGDTAYVGFPKVNVETTGSG